MARFRPNQSIRRQLAAIQGNACWYCRREMTRAKGDRQRPTDRTIDHLLPLARGGTNHVNNLRFACNGCNDTKGTMTDAEFLAAREAAASA